MPKLLPLLEGIASDTVGGGDSTGSEDRVRLLEQILFALTNLAALSNWHMQMRPSLSRRENNPFFISSRSFHLRCALLFAPSFVQAVGSDSVRLA